MSRTGHNQRKKLADNCCQIVDKFIMNRTSLSKRKIIIAGTGYSLEYGRGINVAE